MDSPALAGAGQPYCRRAAWAWLIEAAAYEDTPVDLGGCTVVLERGQLAHSVRFLAEAWNWQKSAVERFIQRLKTETMIETATETGRTVITICNYSRYQATPNYTETLDETVGETPARRRRDSSETNKNQGNQGNQVKYSLTGVGAGEVGEAAPLRDAAPDPGHEALAQPPQLDLLGDPPPTRHKPRADEVPQAVEAWNQMAAGKGLAQAKSIPKLRRRDIQARLDAVGLAGWIEAVQLVGASRNLCGDNASGFKATIDYVARELHFARIIEGQYADGPRPAPRNAPLSAAQHRDAEARARLERLGLSVEDVMRGPAAPRDTEPVIDQAEYSVLEDRIL